MGGGPVVEEPYLASHWGRPNYRRSMPAYGSFPVCGDIFRQPGPCAVKTRQDHRNSSHNREDGAAQGTRNNAFGTKTTSKKRSIPIQVVDTFAEPANVAVDVSRLRPTSEVEATSISPVKARTPEETKTICLSNIEAQDPSMQLEQHRNLSTAKDSSTTLPESLPSTVSNKVDVKAISKEELDEKSTEVKQQSTGEARSHEEIAAILVQSRFRGYWVRRSQPLKHLRIIASVQSRFRELQMKERDDLFQEEVRKDRSMVKSIFLESTMALLLELDAIQGAHPVVRGIRKGVTQEIVLLQEKVDALSLDGKSIPASDQ